MAPASRLPPAQSEAPDGSVAAGLVDKFLAGFPGEESLGMLDDAFDMRILPGSLRVPRMGKAEYLVFLRDGLLKGFKSVKITPTEWIVESQSRSDGPDKGLTRVVIQARSHGISAVDGAEFGQEYFFRFLVNVKTGKIAGLTEYVDSLYMANWTGKQAKAAAAKAKEADARL